jgi:hypothetical protein
MSTTGNATKTKVFVAVDYPSHPRKNSWSKHIINRTENGSAVFKPGTPYTPKQFADLYKSATPIPVNTNPDEVSKFWKKFDFKVGASDGKETKYILIKRNCCKLHARPISKQELRDNYKVKNL